MGTPLIKRTPRVLVAIYIILILPFLFIDHLFIHWCLFLIVSRACVQLSGSSLISSCNGSLQGILHGTFEILFIMFHLVFEFLVNIICRLSFFHLFRAMQQRPSSAYNTPFWTTNSGAPVWNNNSALTIGSRGKN